MMKQPAMKRIAAVFYRAENGTQPVRDWLLTLDRDDRRIVGEDLMTVEFGWPVGMPVCRPLGAGLHEVRSTIQNGRVEARVYFTVAEGQAILLHGAAGKSGQDRAIALARQRLADYHRRIG